MSKSFNFFGKISESLVEKIVDNCKSLDNFPNTRIMLYFDTTLPAKLDQGLHVLVLMEPPAVMPENYSISNLKKPHLVISLSPWRAKTLGTEYWSFQPIEFPTVLVDFTKARKEEIVIINDFKFGATRSSLYGYRRRLIRNLELQDVPIDLYGPNWGMGRKLEFRKRLAAFRRSLRNIRQSSFWEAFGEFGAEYRNFRGEAENKIEVMSAYRFALVIENDIDSLTEKIFDALYAKCTVFYRGPNLKQFMDIDLPHVPLPENVSDAAALIQKYLKSDTRLLEDKLSAFSFESGEMKKFAEKTVAQDIANHISRYVKAQEEMI